MVILLPELATLDSSRTFIREKAAYSGVAGATRVLSRTSSISLLYPAVSVKRSEHEIYYTGWKLNSSDGSNPTRWALLYGS